MLAEQRTMMTVFVEVGGGAFKLLRESAAAPAADAAAVESIPSSFLLLCFSRTICCSAINDDGSMGEDSRPASRKIFCTWSWTLSLLLCLESVIMVNSLPFVLLE